MERESIADLVVRTMEMVKDAQKAAHKYNDFGSMLGIQDEATDLYADLERALHATCKRARRLKGRIERYESGDHVVPLLSSYSNTEGQTRGGSRVV